MTNALGFTRFISTSRSHDEMENSVLEHENVYSSHVQVSPVSVNFPQHRPASPLPLPDGARHDVESLPPPRPKLHEQLRELLVLLLQP